MEFVQKHPISSIIFLVGVLLIVIVAVASCAVPTPPTETGTIVGPTSTEWACGKNGTPDRYIDNVAGIICYTTCAGDISCVPGKDSLLSIFRQ